MGWKFAVGKLGALKNFVRDYIMELECQILQEYIPISVGSSRGSDMDVEEDDDEIEAFDSDFESVDMEMIFCCIY